MSLKPISRRENIVVQELENEVLIYDLNLNKAFCLNESSAIIWQMCDGTKTVAEISRAVGKQLNSNISEEFVWLAIEQFKKDNLLSNDFEVLFESVFAGMTRREIIRKIGLGSMVALPIVSSIIVPTAASAASCLSAFQSCTVGICCPDSICAPTVMGDVCTCQCANPGQCLTQTGCPSTTNCNASMLCAP
jgi:hypothetical protein